MTTVTSLDSAKNWTRYGNIDVNPLHPSGVSKVSQLVEVFTGQIFSPNSNPPHLVGSKSIPTQIQKLMEHPSQSIWK